MPSEAAVKNAVILFQGTVGTTSIYEIFAHATCDLGDPFIFFNNTCDNCGLIPDPLRYANIPELDMSKVKLESSNFFFHQKIILIIFRWNSWTFL
jgi:hypothetical protein